MPPLMLIAALGAVTAPQMQGARLRAGTSCYAIVAGEKAIGSTLQTVTADRLDKRPVWRIVVHQVLANGSFDMRDQFVVDRATLLPISMTSQRGRSPDARGWQRITLTYSDGRVRGTKEIASGTSAIDVALTGPTWDGNLWGLTFAALPLRRGGEYQLPYWQYDKGIGTFTARVVGEEKAETPAGKVDVWVVEAGADPARMSRYTIAKAPRHEIGYSAGPTRQRLGGSCQP